MKIITASSETDASAPLAHTQSDELTRYHPARSLFTVTVVETSLAETTLRLHWRHPNPSAQGASRGALGCVVDYAARFAAMRSLGLCDLTESELEAYKAFTANTLLVTAGVNVAHPESAIFHCTIHTVKNQRTTLVAGSRGTLHKRLCH